MDSFAFQKCWWDVEFGLIAFYCLPTQATTTRLTRSSRIMYTARWCWDQSLKWVVRCLLSLHNDEIISGGCKLTPMNIAWLSHPPHALVYSQRMWPAAASLRVPMFPLEERLLVESSYDFCHIRWILFLLSALREWCLMKLPSHCQKGHLPNSESASTYFQHELLPDFKSALARNLFGRFARSTFCALLLDKIACLNALCAPHALSLLPRTCPRHDKTTIDAHIASI